MAASEALAIERLARADVEGGLRLSDAARWNQTAEDWAFFVDQGEAFGVRDSADGLVATAAALPYGGGVGWISMVLVDAAPSPSGPRDATARRVRRHLAWRRPRRRSSTRRRTVPRSTDRQGSLRDSVSSDGKATPPARAPARADDVVAVTDERQRAALLALDQSVWGIERAALLRNFLARPSTRAWLAADASGFAVLRAGRRAQQLGPIVAADENAALALLDRALGAATGTVFVDVPSHWPTLAGALAGRGFVRQRPFVRMALGDTQALGASGRVFAVAGPEFG